MEREREREREREKFRLVFLISFLISKISVWPIRGNYKTNRAIKLKKKKSNQIKLNFCVGNLFS